MASESGSAAGSWADKFGIAEPPRVSVDNEAQGCSEPASSEASDGEVSVCSAASLRHVNNFINSEGAGSPQG